ncbi:hypothetical protein HHK36_005738 [Tetracentron sinense]|uniref:Rab-GAP TBC domain-containing protein n=1 Tax=Tetracentron sinense TaxID=13715 RepID=A0A834ZQ07_TETSI|nr:hypothetical protein HHK36_005738 [Tetracentron sinense]
MYGTHTTSEISHEFQPQISYWKTSIHTRRANIIVKFQDLYGFSVEGNVDDVNVLNEVREKVRQQGRVWWALEANKGANWYLQPQIPSLSEGIAVSSLKSSLKLSVVANTIVLKRLIRKGIPPVLRPKVWLSVSGAAKKRSTVPESYYNDLTKAVEGKVTPATRQIDHDLPRTFPGHPWLDTPEGHAALRRVLVGYSFRDSDVGYCQVGSISLGVNVNLLQWLNPKIMVKAMQGLNYVAAMLLLVMKTEEDAFWMLAVLLENVLVNDCYTDNLSGCHVEQRVFQDLLAKKCPMYSAHYFSSLFLCSFLFLCLIFDDFIGASVFFNLHKLVVLSLNLKINFRIAPHLEALEFDVSLVATEWFLCLFSKSLPSEVGTILLLIFLFSTYSYVEHFKFLKLTLWLLNFPTVVSMFQTTMRVWDVLFNEGAKVLFHVALAIFKMKEEELLMAHHIGDVISILQRTTHHLYDPDELLTVAFDKIGSMTTNTITKQRKKQEPAVMAELDQRLRRLNSLKMNDK